MKNEGVGEIEKMTGEVVQCVIVKAAVQKKKKQRSIVKYFTKTVPTTVVRVKRKRRRG